MATLSRLVVRIEGSTVGISRALKSTETRVERFRRRASRAFASILRATGALAIGGGALLLGFTVNAIKTFAELGDTVQKTAIRTGLSTEEVSRLGFAAQQTGADITDIDKGIRRMNSTIFDAERGLMSATDAFDALGIDLDSLTQLTTYQQFLLIAEALAGVEDHYKRAALAEDIFGRAGNKLLPLLSSGEAGILQLGDEAQRLGVVFSQSAADQAAELVDALGEVDAATNGLKFTVAGAIVPFVVQFIRGFREAGIAVNGGATDIAASSKTIGANLTGIGVFARELGRLVSDKLGLVGEAPQAIRDFVGVVTTANTQVERAMDGIANLFIALPGRIVSALRGTANVVIDFFNHIIRAWNQLEFTLPSATFDLPGIGRRTIGGGTVGTVDIPEIPRLREPQSAGYNFTFINPRAEDVPELRMRWRQELRKAQNDGLLPGPGGR